MSRARILAVSLLGVIAAAPAVRSQDAPRRAARPTFRLADDDPGAERQPAPVAPAAQAPPDTQRALAPLRRHDDRPVAARNVVEEPWTYAVAPPAGLIPARGTQPPSVERNYRDPLAPVYFTASVLPRHVNLERSKQRIIRAYTQSLTRFRIVRDERRKGLARDAWIVEIESSSRRRACRQLQLFVDLGDRVLVLTYATETKRWKRYLPVFERSLASLRLSRDPDALANDPRVDLSDALRSLPDVPDRETTRGADSEGCENYGFPVLPPIPPPTLPQMPLPYPFLR